MDQRHPGFTSKDLLELQEEWRARVSEARARYARCSQDLREVAAEVRGELLPIEDGGCALRNALKRQNAALAEYMRVLHIFTGLVMDGKIPEGKQ